MGDRDLLNLERGTWDDRTYNLFDENQAMVGIAPSLPQSLRDSSLAEGATGLGASSAEGVQWLMSRC